MYQLNQWQRETEDPSEFLDSLRFELNTTEVYVFTPKGDLIALPQGSTPVDMAYAIHSEVGDRCIGARVNGRLVPLDSKLANGDICEILVSRSEDAGPSRDWLGFVASPRARSKIKQHFTRERREEAIEQGKNALAKQLRKSGMPLQRLLTIEHLTAVADTYRLSDVNALYAAIGEGNIGAQAVVQRLVETEGGLEATVIETLEEKQPVPSPARRSRGKDDVGIVVQGDRTCGSSSRSAPRCPGTRSPLVTRENGVSVHRDRTSGEPLSQPERIVEGVGALVERRVPGLGAGGGAGPHRPVVGPDQGAVRPGVSILGGGEHHQGPIACPTHLRVLDPGYLAHVISQMRKVSGVYDIYRVSQGG